jgi:hypothetical protein
MKRPSIDVLEGGPKGGFFERSKPQYESIPASGFTNVKSFGAKGDGKADDTAAIKNALSGTAGKSILYFPAGSYIVTDTITVSPTSAYYRTDRKSSLALNTTQIPADVKIVGEAWSQIVGSGSKFSDINNSHVMVQVGLSGQIGNVEISDILFTARGPTAGIILMEWNMMATGKGTSGMWGMNNP